MNACMYEGGRQRKGKVKTDFHESSREQHLHDLFQNRKHPSVMDSDALLQEHPEHLHLLEFTIRRLKSTDALIEEVMDLGLFLVRGQGQSQSSS